MASDRITLADVARSAGVSQTTASFVLTGRGGEMRISAEASARVREAVRDTGYRPNIVSRSLRTGTSHTIGFVSDTVATTPFAGHMIWGALDAARANGRLLIIGESEGDADIERQLIGSMQDRAVDAFLLVSMYLRELAVPEGLLERPFVLLNALPTSGVDAPAVVPDETAAGRTAVEVLLEAGHGDRVALVGGAPPGDVPRGMIAVSQRLRGIMDGLSAAGHEPCGAVPLADWQPENGYEATRALLRDVSPTALICFNDRLAFGAYQAIADAGLRVPDDISVVSFDDDALATWVRPQLTTVALPHYELGYEAVNLLLTMSEGSTAEPQGSRVRQIPMPLRRRWSVRQLGDARSPATAARPPARAPARRRAPA